MSLLPHAGVAIGAAVAGVALLLPPATASAHPADVDPAVTVTVDAQCTQVGALFTVDVQNDGAAPVELDVQLQTDDGIEPSSITAPVGSSLHVVPTDELAPSTITVLLGEVLLATFTDDPCGLSQLPPLDPAVVATIDTRCVAGAPQVNITVVNGSAEAVMLFAGVEGPDGQNGGAPFTAQAGGTWSTGWIDAAGTTVASVRRYTELPGPIVVSAAVPTCGGGVTLPATGSDRPLLLSAIASVAVLAGMAARRVARRHA